MIPIYISQSLQQVLLDRGIDNYCPAYEGESAALDLYNAGPEIYVRPYKSIYDNVEIPTGLHIAIPRGYVGLITERGSIGKTDLKLLAGVVDTGFSGPIFVKCYSRNPELIWPIEPGAKLPFQLIVVANLTSFTQIDKSDFDEYHRQSKRQSGSKGSSDG